MFDDSHFMLVCTDGFLFFHINNVFSIRLPAQVTDKRKRNGDVFVSTSSIAMSSMSVSARSWECSVITCRALIIKFSVSSVLLEDSLSMALRRGKQKEKAGADSGATSKGKNTENQESSQYASRVTSLTSRFLLQHCSSLTDKWFVFFFKVMMMTFSVWIWDLDWLLLSDLLPVFFI